MSYKDFKKKFTFEIEYLQKTIKIWSKYEGYIPTVPILSTFKHAKNLVNLILNNKEFVNSPQGLLFKKPGLYFKEDIKSAIEILNKILKLDFRITPPNQSHTFYVNTRIIKDSIAEIKSDIIKIKSLDKKYSTKIQSIRRFYKSQNMKLISDMVEVPELKRYANILMSLDQKWNKIYTRNTIARNIAVCHIKPNESLKGYLSSKYKQFNFIAKKYYRISEAHKKKFLKRLVVILNERPCLENLIDGLTAAMFPASFKWSGRNINVLRNNNQNRYLNEVIAPAMISWKNSKLKLPNNITQRRNLFWNAIKNENVHAWTNNGPAYIKIRNYNRGGQKITNDYLNYLKN
jgi:hypothetical protein